MKNPTNPHLAVTAVCLLTLQSASAAVVIDDFTQGSNSVSYSGSSSANEQQQVSNLFETTDLYRDVVVSAYSTLTVTPRSGVVAGNQFSAERGGTEAASGDHKIAYTNDSQTNNWNQYSWNYTGLAGLTTINIDFATNTFAGLYVQVMAEKWDFGFANYVTTSSGLTSVSTVGASVVGIDLTSMDQAILGEFDKLTFTFTYDPAWQADQSFSINSITAAIPEPGSVALFGLGAISLLVRRRRC